MNRKRSGLTVIEILVVVGIIALLAGMLIPAASTVKKMAKEVKQRAQLTAIQLGLAAFKNDYGDYPPSDPFSWLNDTRDVENSSGAQKLAEALLGWDLLGFHPDSGFRADGYNRWPYEIDGTLHAEGTYPLYDRTSDTDLEKRKGRYIDLDTANAFQLGRTGNHDGLFVGDLGPFDSSADTFVICDVFGKGRDVTLRDGSREKAGNPILYYRAHASEKVIAQIYQYTDNDSLVFHLKEPADVARRGTAPSGGLWNRLTGHVSRFYNYIEDPRASTAALEVPYKPDSYILISAGADGLYGTEDDICNFKR